MAVDPDKIQFPTTLVYSPPRGRSLTLEGVTGFESVAEAAEAGIRMRHTTPTSGIVHMGKQMIAVDLAFCVVQGQDQ